MWYVCMIGVMSLRMTFLDDKDWRSWRPKQTPLPLVSQGNMKGSKADKAKGGGTGATEGDGMMDSDDEGAGGGGEGTVNPADLSDEERREKQWCRQKKDEARRTITRFRLKLGGGGTSAGAAGGGGPGR